MWNVRKGNHLHPYTTFTAPIFTKLSTTQQDRQFTYNVQKGAFVQPLLPWKSNKYYIFSVSTCSLRHPACNVQALHCHPLPARLHGIFPHYLINGTIFGKRLMNIKCVLVLFTNLSNISHSKKH